MKKIKNISVTLLLVIFVVSLFLNVRHYTMRNNEPHRDTVRTTFVDTIPYLKPVPKDSTVIKYVTVKVPTSVPKSAENELKTAENEEIPRDSVENFGKSVPDSVDIELPITQKVYRDSTYTAYISGYNPRLDSLLVYPKTQIITITEKAKPKRWSVGVQVGYGMTLNGTPQFAPYIGVGVSYNLFNF